MLAMALPWRFDCGTMSLLSHTGDGAAGVAWPWRDVTAESCWRRCYRVILAMALLGQLGQGAMLLSSHADDGATESCW
jgi:hypothetical protein